MSPDDPALADYRVETLIASGGFGSIYRVRHRSGRAGALKTLRPELADQTEAVLRFEREVLATQRAPHPNIIGIQQVGRLSDGRPFLVMDLLEGVTLDELIHRRTRLTPSECLALLAPIADALGTVHALDIVHRDVKASNVFIEDPDRSPRPVLLDFGIAKLLDPAAASITSSRKVIGTPCCMAPEQSLGGDIGAHTDVYALGALLYHMLTGRPAFDDPSATIMKHMHAHARRPRPSALAPVSGALDALVLQAMSIHPGERTPGAAAFAASLRTAVDGGATPVTVARPAVAIHLAVRPPAGAELDEAWLAEVAEVLSLADHCFAEVGLHPAHTTPVSTLYVGFLPAGPAERATRAAAVAAALRIHGEITGDPAIGQVVMCVQVGTVETVGDQVLGGELLHLAWLPDAGVSGVTGHPGAIHDLGLATAAVAEDHRLRRVCT